MPALQAGSVEVSGETVTFVTRAADVAEISGCDVESGECGGDWESQATWTMEGDTVTFAAVDEVPMDVLLVVEPWQRIS